MGRRTGILATIIDGMLKNRKRYDVKRKTVERSCSETFHV